MGDMAVTEGWAALFEGLLSEPAWIERRLDFARPREFAAESGVIDLFFARRYAAKLLYELEFYRAADPTEMRGRYVELLGDALKVEPLGASYLADIDPGFYVTEYLRSWGFEAQLRDFLRTEFGNAWFTRREAGAAARAVVGRPGAHGRRDAPGPDRLAHRDGRARRAHPRVAGAGLTLAGLRPRRLRRPARGRCPRSTRARGGGRRAAPRPRWTSPPLSSANASIAGSSSVSTGTASSGSAQSPTRRLSHSERGVCATQRNGSSPTTRSPSSTGYVV